MTLEEFKNNSRRYSFNSGRAVGIGWVYNHVEYKEGNNIDYKGNLGNRYTDCWDMRKNKDARHITLRGFLDIIEDKNFK